MNVKIVGEGSEEQGTGGLEAFVPENPDLLSADAILVCDTGNFAVGVPSLTTSLRGLANVWVTVRTASMALHSGMYGGAARMRSPRSSAMLATLARREGNTTIDGLDSSQTWPGAGYPPEQFRQDAGVLDGVDLLGDNVSDMLWARPAATVLGIDCPPVVGSSAAIQPEARARINLRVPPGMDAEEAQTALIEHLKAVAPWNVQLEFEREAEGEPFNGPVEGPGVRCHDLCDAQTPTVATSRCSWPERLDPALHRVPGDVPRRGDHAARSRGAAVPDPRSQRERRSGEIEKMALVEALFMQQVRSGEILVAQRWQLSSLLLRSLPRTSRGGWSAPPSRRAAGLTGILVTPGPDLLYFTGYQPIAITERITMLALQPHASPR